jgi:S-DNA-T family DNA segregation ATPase FtsK/SpoIIIE
MDLSAKLTQLLEERATRRDQRNRANEALEAYGHYAPVWRRLCEYIGLSHTVSTVCGPSIVTPRLLGVGVTGPNPVLLVEMLPGQLIEEFRREADRMVATLGCRFLRFTPRDQRYLAIELLDADPLDTAVTVDVDMAGARHSVAKYPVMLAQTETGERIWLSWATAPHTVVQGATRSGKSVWCYSLLGQLVRCDDVLITGSDPSGLLLGRPYVGTRHREWQAVGTQDVQAHVTVLRRIVAEMDRRISELPDREDTLVPSLENPLLLVVLEEFAGLLRLASTLPTPRGEAKVTDQLRALFGRLVSEGHKVAIRLVVVSQRADASIIGGFERGQLGLRLSFRVTDPEALAMLHPEGRDWFADHAHASAGVALLETPSQTVTRVRGPRLTGDDLADYAQYWDQVQAATACRQLHAA